MTRVIIIGGLGRSGATLLARLLGELPGVVALGDGSQLWRRVHEGGRCGCGEPWRGCGFWCAVGEAAFGGWDAVDVDRVLELRRRVERAWALPGLVLDRPQPEARAYAAYHRRVYAAASRIAGARVVIVSAEHSALPWSLRQTGLDLRVVHLVRDPRAVAHSGAGPVGRPGHAAATALRWNLHNTALSLLSRRGTPLFRLRYEALVAQPTAALRDLVEFAGVGATADLSFVGRSTVTLGPSHFATGDPPAFTVLPLQRDGDRWRRDLAPRQRRLVGAVCAPLMPAYGYPLRVGGER